jgi:tetratricopeptide (TPR) repeat protein
MIGNEERFTQAMNLGHTAAWEQTWEQAASHYRQALDEFPENPKALTSLALALYELGEYQEALNNYTRAAELSPHDPTPNVKIAEILERTGQQAAAIKVYMRVAELYANGRDFEKAVEYWSHIISIDPENLSAHSRLAFVYEKLGRKQQSIIEYISIASLMQQSGEVQKAIAATNHALQISPESIEAKQALRMLQSGRLLPKPKSPQRMKEPLLPLVAPKPKSASTTETRQPDRDPIESTHDKAISTLAGLIFEPVDARQPAQERHGMQSLMRGEPSQEQKLVDSTKINLHLSQAIDSQSRNEYAQASKELERAMESGLDNAAASFEMGYLLYKNNEVESSARKLQRSVKHEEYAFGSRLLLGQVLFHLERISEASTQFLEALKIADASVVDPEKSAQLAGLYDPIIEANTQQRDPGKQEQLCKNISELLVRPDWREHLLRTREQIPDQTDLETPTPLAEMITEAKSGQVVEMFTFIKQLARSGNFRTAMEEAFYALQYAPTYLPLHTFIGELLLQENRVQEAVEKFTIVAKCYNIRGEAFRGISILNRVISLSPMDVHARYLLIESHIARGEVDDAVREFINLSEVYYNLADLKLARQTYLRAYQYLQQIHADSIHKVNILNRIADIYLQSLDWRQALLVFEQIRTLIPDDGKTRKMIIDLNLRLNQDAQAIAEMDNHLSSLIKRGEQNNALIWLEELVEEQPNHPKIRRRLADLYRRLGRTDEAIRHLDQVGELLIEAGDQEGAIKTILMILALNPPNAAEYKILLDKLKQG